MQSKYTEIVRCVCLKAHTACSAMCHSKNCNNPEGKRPETSMQKSRKRTRHPWQVTIPKSAVFALQEGESIKTGSRSIPEFFLLDQCLAYCRHENIEDTAENLHVLYNTLVDISKAVYDDLTIKSKELKDIETFLKEYHLLKTKFEAFCIASIKTKVNMSQLYIHRFMQ